MVKDPVQGIRVVPDESNGRYFHVVISGPEDSPFEGGRFKLELFLPVEYPMAAPKVRFITRIYHPNVDKLGRICLDILKGSSSVCNVRAACCFFLFSFTLALSFCCYFMFNIIEFFFLSSTSRQINGHLPFRFVRCCSQFRLYLVRPTLTIP